MEITSGEISIGITRITQSQGAIGRFLTLYDLGLRPIPIHGAGGGKEAAGWIMDGCLQRPDSHCDGPQGELVTKFAAILDLVSSLALPLANSLCLSRQATYCFLSSPSTSVVRGRLFVVLGITFLDTFCDYKQFTVLTSSLLACADELSADTSANLDLSAWHARR